MVVNANKYFNESGDFVFEIYNQLIKYSICELPRIILGVGSITDAAAASQYILSGAYFIVTPVFREDIAIVCNRRKVLWSPGCGSLTEIATAEEMGCEVIKLSPGSTYGTSFVKAIKGVQPWTSITGGVSIYEANLKGWFDAGVTCVGMGSKLISKEILANQSYAELTNNVKDTLTLIQRLKG